MSDAAGHIRLICTSDLHGAVMPYNYADRAETMQGLARVKTLINTLRDAHTIVIDNGDTIEGSALTLYHYLHRRDDVCPVTCAMRAVGYDYVNVGNHDFNEGTEALLKHLEETGATCITSNFFYQGEAVGAPYIIRTIQGKMIALFGLTTQYIPHWESPSHLTDVTFTDAYETAMATVRTLRSLPVKERPDVIVCVYHGGFERDPETGEETERDTGENEGYRILQIEGLDILFSGHQHRVFCGTTADGTVYTQPAANGRFVAVADIDTATGEISASLHAADCVPDERIIDLIREEEDACGLWLDEALGTCVTDLTVQDAFDARLHKSQVITFLNHVQREVTGAELSATALFGGATGFHETVTMRDLVSTYVFPNTLTVKRVTGKTLRAYLEHAAAYWTTDENGRIAVSPRFDGPHPEPYNYDMIDGVDYTIRVSRPEGERIETLLKDGSEVADDDVFTLVVNNYRASGGGGYRMIAEAETVKEYQTGMVEILANYIMTHPVIDFTPVHNIKVIV